MITEYTIRVDEEGLTRIDQLLHMLSEVCVQTARCHPGESFTLQYVKGKFAVIHNQELPEVMRFGMDLCLGLEIDRLLEKSDK